MSIIDLSEIPNGKNIEIILKILRIILSVKGKKYQNNIINRPEEYIRTSILNKMDRLRFQIESKSNTESNDLFDLAGYCILALTQKLLFNTEKFKKDIKDIIRD
jgi:hypothetical protein